MRSGARVGRTAGGARLTASDQCDHNFADLQLGNSANGAVVVAGGWAPVADGVPGRLDVVE